MISVNWEKLLGEFSGLAGAFEALPSHIAKKHLLASMKRSFTVSGAVKQLRQNTPPVGARRGRRRKGEKRSTGALRRAVTTKARWIGRNKDGVAVAGLGYKYGMESQKAIWQEFGTTRMAGRAMMQKTFEQVRGRVAASLAGQLAKALEKAADELGRNPGMSRRGMAAGIPPR